MKVTIEVEHFAGAEISTEELASAFIRTFNTVPGNTFAVLPKDRALELMQQAVDDKQGKGKTVLADVETALAEEPATYRIVSVTS